MLLPAGLNANSASAAIASDGRINLTLQGIAYWMLAFPFLNVWKCGGDILVITGATKRFSHVPPGSPSSPWDGYLDSEGELARPLPDDVTQVVRIFYSQPRDGVPAGYNRVGERWVLKWDGTAANVSVANASALSHEANRITWTWSSNTANMWVTFAGMDHNNPPHNVRLCEQKYEARLDAGEIFNPDWLEVVRLGSGIIRLMGWQSTNNDFATLRFSDIPDQRYCAYGSYTSKPRVKGGMSLSIISDLANRVQSHPWVCVPNVFGTKKLSLISTISKANPAVVTSPGHKWEDGDQVIPYGTTWPALDRNRFTVVQSDQKAGTFALAGVDSTNFGPFTSNWAAATAPYDLDNITKQLTPFAAHFRDNVGPGLVTYFEFGNELWNAIFNAFHWLAAQARGKIKGDDPAWMAGYLAAHVMKVIRDAYGPSGSTRWRGVLATQTTNTFVTERLIVGANQYLSEHAPSLKLTDLFGDLAVTGYFGGDMGRDQQTTVMNWTNVSEQRWTAGLEPTKYSYFNRVVNEDAADGRYTHIRTSLDKVVEFWRAQKALADANGLGLIQYEGGNNNVPFFVGALDPAAQAHFLEFYVNCSHTIEDARNYTSMFTSFAEMGGRYPSKFVETGAVTRFGNWGALRYLGDSNPVWDAVVTFNARH
jgi:hypothetical protein